MVPVIVKIVALACSVSAVAVLNLQPLSDEAIDLINSKQTTWKAGRNFPQNTPLSYMKNLLRVLPNNKQILPKVTHSDELKASLPENFDAREKWPNCPSIGEIRDGSCGSCWAFGTVEVITDRVCIFSNGTKNFHFSAEDLIDCSNDYLGVNGCRGGRPQFAFEYWVNHGIVSGGNYNSSQGCKPYSTPPCVHHAPGQIVNSTDVMACLNSYKDTPKCSKTCEDGYGKEYEGDKMYEKRAYTIDGGEDDIKAEIFKNGPVVVGFIVASDFYNYKSGVYKHTQGEYIGAHVVKIIGWSVEDGTKYWLIANSWNAGWGDKGFSRYFAITTYIDELYLPRECFLLIRLDAERIRLLCLEVNVESIVYSICTSKLRIKPSNISIVSDWAIKVSAEPAKSGGWLNMSLQQLARQLPGVVVKGLPQVSRAVIACEDADHKPRYKLCVEGDGLRNVMATYGVNGTKTTSNNILEVYATLGVEAAKSTIISEIQGVMAGHGMSVDRRHVELLAGQMTARGEVLGITRYGLARMKESVLNLASFEKTADHLFDAAYYGQQDCIEGVSESIILGVPAAIGTGVLQLLHRSARPKTLPTRTLLFDRPEYHDSIWE